MHPTQLRHRIVAVFDEHLLVELLGPLEPDGGVERDVPGDVEVAHELVEKEAAQALGRPGVPGEQGPLDHLGQVHQGEDGQMEVGHVAPKDGGLVLRELLFYVGEHGRPTIGLG